MSQLNQKGPENKGPKTGRKLGKCKKSEDEILDFDFGEGMGKKRRMGGGQGRGQRLHTFDKRTEK
jgi:hypothetical protein